MNTNPEPWPPDAQAFLTQLYAQYGTEQTPEQKFNVLCAHMGTEPGDHFFSHDPTWEQKLACLEHQVLEREGLIEPVLC
ncbi:MAG: hypothetical protein RLY57_162 [Candidatus Parcubacteria bacterium]|jgi:hypothetical protein